MRLYWWLLLGFGTRAQAQHSLPLLPDSLRPAGPLAGIRATPLRVAVAPPVLLIGYGLLTRDDHGGPLESSYDAQWDLQRHFKGFSTHLDDYTRYVPTYAGYGLSLAGVPARHDLTERTLLFGFANLLTNAITGYLKGRTQEPRPYDPNNLSSFPSYQTGQAFTGATFLAEEYGGRSVWYSVGGYTVAAATGALRMLNNQHWLSDVTVAAGIGILSTEAVYAVYPLVKRVVFRGRSPQALLLPARPEGSRAGVALVWLLR